MASLDFDPELTRPRRFKDPARTAAAQAAKQERQRLKSREAALTRELQPITQELQAVRQQLAQLAA